LEDKDPRTSVIPATGDLTIAMLLGLAYRLVDADRYTRCGKFRQEQTVALMGVGCRGKAVGGCRGLFSAWCRSYSVRH
jgi:lactate dehydrogenase-like 2-hydroxyacid dehydrogenase